MKAVTITKHETCLSYALKRIGLENTDVYKYEHLSDDFEIIPFLLGTKLKVGHILLWDSNLETADLPWHITEDGRIINQPVKRRIHLGVWEGDGLVSDCSRLNSQGSLPQLRLRNLSDIGRRPDKILILKKS